MLAAIGWGELVIILIIAGVLVLIFGATRIPKIARALGLGLKELKKGVKEANADDEGKPAAKKPAASKAKAKKR